MTTRAIAVSAAALLAAAGAASAQTFTFDWKVNGGKNVSVAPGTVVNVVGYATWTDPTAVGFGSMQFKVNLTGANASDGINAAEPAWGRNPLLSFAPQTMTVSTTGTGRQVSAGGSDIDVVQFQPFFNDAFDFSNPIQVFSMQVTAGAAGRTIGVGSSITAFEVFADMMGTPAVMSSSVSGATIQVVPAAGPAALLGLGGLVAARRRRN